MTEFTELRPLPTLTLLEVLRQLCCQSEACACRGAARRGIGSSHCPLCAVQPNLSLRVRATSSKLVMDCTAGCDAARVIDGVLNPHAPPAPEPPAPEPRFVRIPRPARQRGARAAGLAAQEPPKPTLEHWTPRPISALAACRAAVRGEDWEEDELAGFINARRQAPM